MDAYEEFKALMHNWVRIVGACLGYDIQPDHIGVNALIVVSLFCSVTIPCLYFSAYLTLDGDIAMAGAGLTGTALKVIDNDELARIEIEKNSKALSL